MTHQELNVRHKQEAAREEHTRPGRTFIPDVDIYETADRLWLWADMPGVDESSVTVDLADGTLSISGQVALQEYDNLMPVYTEYNVGNYMRRFTVSNTIDAPRISARMTNGVLTVELPKSDAAKPRKITVSVE